MAKFRIANDPTFELDVDIPRVGGPAIKVPITFKYRDRTQLATLFAAWQARIEADHALLQQKSPAISLSELTEMQINRQVEQLSELLAGWGFDDALDLQSIRALVNTSSGAAEAIIHAYQQAYTQARLGN